MRRVLLIATLIGLSWSGFAASEIDQCRTKFTQAKDHDNAASAAALTGLISEAATKAAAATHFANRRNWEILLHDMQDAIGGMKSPEALKIFANMLPKSPPDAQVVLCMGLKRTPASADVDAAATGLIKTGVNFRVLVAAMELAAAHKNAAAVEKIIGVLDPKAFPSVQIAALRALAQLPDKASVPAIMKYLKGVQGDGGRYLYEATTALRAITGEKLDAIAPELTRWWERNEKDWVFDPAKAKTPVYNYELTEKKEVEYYDIPVVENRLVIVLDCSGSMQMGGSPNRMEQAKDALKLLISRLRDKQMFNIVTFSNAPRRWKKTPPLVQATEAARKEATAYVEALTAGGGTQTTSTMEETLREVAITTGCETIFLVTDGNPNPWSQEVTNEMQVRHISWINESLKVRINTIGIYNRVAADNKYPAEDKEKMQEFLKKLAQNNDGIYKEIGGEAKKE
ncbi:MAG TPA: VWA domain-containing protein [Planctomycetota bacterium]|nr:VWA domain-containing protein [Planctomycetota bacterium]